MARQNPYRIRLRHNADCETVAQVPTKRQADKLAAAIRRTLAGGKVQLEALNPRPGKPNTWAMATVGGRWHWVPIKRPTNDPREIRDQVRAFRTQREGRA